MHEVEQRWQSAVHQVQALTREKNEATDKLRTLTEAKTRLESKTREQAAIITQMEDNSARVRFWLPSSSVFSLISMCCSTACCRRRRARRSAS